MPITCKKVGLICAAAATAAVFCAMPVSVQRSTATGIALSVDKAHAVVVVHRRPVVVGRRAVVVHRRIR